MEKIYFYKNLKEQCYNHYTSLENNVQNYLGKWQTLSDFISPDMGVFDLTEGEEGQRKDIYIRDNTATVVMRTFGASVQSSVTNAALPWFAFTHRDNEIVENFSKDLFDMATIMRRVYAGSNYYSTREEHYRQFGLFSNSAIYVERDDKTVFHTYLMPIGAFRWANDDKGRIGVFSRPMQMTVRKIIDKFVKKDGTEKDAWDWHKVSQQIREDFERGTNGLDTKHDIYHLIIKNKYLNARFSKLTPFSKPYLSLYFETGSMKGRGLDFSSDADVNDGKFLSIEGYSYFPVWGLRWNQNGRNEYGSGGPGDVVLGDVKSLQKAAYDLSLGLDYMVSPTWQLPFSMKQHNSNMAPGDKVYSQESGKDNGAKQISNVKLDYMPLTEYVRTLQQRIKDGGYYDLLMLQQLQEKAGATATEANIWSNKEPFLFGPVQQKIEIDDLVPSIDIVTQFADEAGLFDHISEELRGEVLDTEFVSTMKRKQKGVALGELQNFSNYLLNIMSVFPEARNAINIHEFIKNVSEKTGIDPEIVRSKFEYDTLSAQQQQQAQQQQEAELGEKMSKSAKNLSGASMEGDTALTKLLGANTND